MPARSNHSCGNMGLEGLVDFERKLGLAGCSIAWGVRNLACWELARHETEQSCAGCGTSGLSTQHYVHISHQHQILIEASQRAEILDLGVSGYAARHHLADHAGAVRFEHAWACIEARDKAPDMRAALRAALAGDPVAALHERVDQSQRRRFFLNGCFLRVHFCAGLGVWQRSHSDAAAHLFRRIRGERHQLTHLDFRPTRVRFANIHSSRKMLVWARPGLSTSLTRMEASRGGSRRLASGRPRRTVAAYPMSS